MHFKAGAAQICRMSLTFHQNIPHQPVHPLHLLEDTEQTPETPHEQSLFLMPTSPAPSSLPQASWKELETISQTVL